MVCNCICENSSGVPTGSGKCCYYNLASGWVCLDYVTESYCNTLFFGRYENAALCSGVLDCTTSCFMPDTEISMADGTLKAIQNVERGNQVNATNGTVNNVIEPIQTTLGNRRLVDVNHKGAFITEDHPVLSRNGLKSFNINKSRENYPHLFFMGEFNIGDDIVTESGYEQVSSFEYISKDPNTVIYNLSLDGDNTYFAKGYGVHNKSEPPDPTGQAPSSGEFCGGFIFASSGSIGYELRLPAATSVYYTNGVFASGAAGSQINGNLVTQFFDLSYADPQYDATINTDGDALTMITAGNCFVSGDPHSSYSISVTLTGSGPSVTGLFTLLF